MRSVKEQLKLIKSYTFVNKVMYKNKRFEINFKPIIAKINKFRLYPHGKNYETRYICIGKATFKAYPSNNYNCGVGFSVHSEITHTNALGGHPCLGEQMDWFVKFYKEEKLVELTLLMHQWFLTFNYNGYKKPYAIYFISLKRGFPCWDENKVRIKFNDPKRIETEELKKFKKRKDYTINKRRFARLKL